MSLQGERENLRPSHTMDYTSVVENSGSGMFAYHYTLRGEKAQISLQYCVKIYY